MFKTVASRSNSPQISTRSNSEHTTDGSGSDDSAENEGRKGLSVDGRVFRRIASSGDMRGGASTPAFVREMWAKKLRLSTLPDIHHFFRDTEFAPLDVLLHRITKSQSDDLSSLGAVHDALNLFEKGLSTLLEASQLRGFVTQINQLKLKIVGVVGLTLPELRQEALPSRVLEGLTPFKIVDFFLKVLPQICLGTTFGNFKALITEYNSHVLSVKQDLFDREDGRALGWKPRNPFLFAWCRVLIESTGHPSLAVLKKTTDRVFARDDGFSMTAGNLQQKSYDTFTKFVLPLTCADDIADILQDSVLLNFFTDVFKLENYSDLRRVDSESIAAGFSEPHSGYKSFFQFYVKTFKDAMNEMALLVGEPALDANWAVINNSWQKVMACLHQSVAINKTLTEGASVDAQSIKAEELMLAQNMLMSFFKELEKIIISVYGVPDTISSHEGSRAVFEKAEILGHAANHWATLSREVGEGDYSNTILLILEATVTHQLACNDGDFAAFCKKKLQMELPAEVTSFPRLLAYLKEIDQRVVGLAIPALKAMGWGRSDAADLLQSTSPYVLSKYIFDRSGTNIAELDSLCEEKKRLSQLVVSLAKRLHVFETYGERIEFIFDQLDASAAPRSDLFAEYISGVEDLVTLYLACKREI
jgi:hypothetical protein